MTAILSLATAVPPHRFHQDEAKATALRLFGEAHGDGERRLALFDNAGITWRYSCLPLDACTAPRSFAARNALAVEEATALGARAAERALVGAGLRPADVDSVVAVCSTGIATPSLDAHLAERMGFRHDVERTPLFGLGCAGGVLGLARAASLARAKPGSVVLLVVAELCTLTLRPADTSKANFVACALFGDGAAAAVLSTDGPGRRVGACGEHRWPGTLDVMGWSVEEDGLGVLFSVAVPEIARRRMREAADGFLHRQRLSRADIDRWICHPGGAKVVAGLEEALELRPPDLDDTRSVLDRFGNMSAATVMFVLEAALARDDWERGLVTSLGPGFTAGFALVERPQ